VLIEEKALIAFISETNFVLMSNLWRAPSPLGSKQLPCSGFCTKRCATVFQMKQNLPHDGELKTHVQCFYDMGKENLYIMRSRLLKKKLWHTFVRKSLLKNIKKLAILQVIS